MRVRKFISFVLKSAFLGNLKVFSGNLSTWTRLLNINKFREWSSSYSTVYVRWCDFLEVRMAKQVVYQLSLSIFFVWREQ